MDAMIKDKTKSRTMSSKTLGKYFLKTVKIDESPNNLLSTFPAKAALCTVFPLLYTKWRVVVRSLGHKRSLRRVPAKAKRPSRKGRKGRLYPDQARGSGKVLPPWGMRVVSTPSRLPPFCCAARARASSSVRATRILVRANRSAGMSVTRIIW